MKTISNIIYGLIVGRWLLNVCRRLSPEPVSGRYVVIGEHVNYPGLYVEIGCLSKLDDCNRAFELVDDSVNFMCEIFDSSNPEGFKQIKDRHPRPFSALSREEQIDLAEARRFCTRCM